MKPNPLLILSLIYIIIHPLLILAEDGLWSILIVSIVIGVLTLMLSLFWKPKGKNIDVIIWGVLPMLYYQFLWGMNYLIRLL